jgi:hypothetical protein
MERQQLKLMDMIAAIVGALDKRNRGVWGTEGAAGAMGIRPARMAFKNAARKSKGRRKAA